MQTFTMLATAVLLATAIQAQLRSDSCAPINRYLRAAPIKVSLPTRSFTTAFSAFDADIFNPFYQIRQRNFKVLAGINQSFMLNPAQTVWVGNRPNAPITPLPEYPNFVPVRASPSVGLQRPNGTFYSFAQGDIHVNQFNPSFQGLNVVTPLGGRKPR